MKNCIYLFYTKKMFKLFSFFIMLFSFKQDSFIKAFFREPNKDIYTINNELLIEKDLNWSTWTKME